MNKTALKIFISFSFIAAVTSIILLCINALGIAVIESDTKTYIHNHTPQYLIENIGDTLIQKEDEYILTDDIIPDDCWCILLNDNGDIIWSKNQPDDIPTHYTIKDIALLTRWFLNDYPVYVRAEEYGLLILGIPKNAVGKYDMEYSMDWFDTLAQRVFMIFLFNLILALLFAFLFGFKLYQNLKTIITATKDLKNEKVVKLSEKGLFSEVAKNINETSNAIERKNTILTIRDNARLNWIAGISHDIRTPLAIIMGNSEFLQNVKELSQQNRKKAASITAQSIKVKKLIEDLNLISSLEYDMQPIKRKNIKICPFIRRIVSDFINNGLSEKFEIDINLQYEQAVVLGDKSLLERAFFNIINNSVKHNENGCTIHIDEYKNSDFVVIHIYDNGKGVTDEVIQNMSIMPKTTHGLGIPLAFKTIHVHGGTFEGYNENGFHIKIKLPIQI